MKKITLLFGLGLFLIACSPKTAEVTEKAETLTFPNETVSTGFALYGEKCTRCHKAKTVKDFTREEWNSILPRMAKKAKLEGEEETTIDTYINWELER